MGLDFKVKWDGTEKEVSENILVKYIDKRLRSKMPMVIILYGKSRTGKSRFALKISDGLYKRRGLDFATFLEKCVLIKPEDWDTKARNIFEQNDPITKKIVTIQLDEAKFILNAADWQSLKNRTIQTVAATSASIKPVCFFIIAQLLKDVNAKTRETADLIIKLTRSPGEKPRVSCKIPYEKLIDISTIKIMPRAFIGNITYPDGTKETLIPEFRPSLPRKEVDDVYDNFESHDKKEQIFAIFDNLKKQREKLSKNDSSKVQKLAEYFIEKPAELEKIARYKRNKWKMGLAARKRFGDLSERDFKQLELFVNDGLKDKAIEVVKHGMEQSTESREKN